MAVIYLGKKFDLKDYPNSRKIHKKPVPLTGGIAVFAGFGIATVRNMVFTDQVKGVLLGALIIFIVGLLDDKYKLSAFIKLAFQFVAVSALIYFGIRVKVIPHSVPFKILGDVLITYIGVIGITNAFNYLDGMDGEAAGLAIISSLTLFFIAHDGNILTVSWLAMALAGSTAGFLPYNFPKAKVFLGDNGSTVVGFLLASIAIAGSWNAASLPVAIVTPLLIFSLYIFDMAYTTVSRIKNGTVRNFKEWIVHTGKDHIHHRLVKIGFTKNQAVIIIWVCALIFGFSAFVIRKAQLINTLVIMTQSLLIYLLIIVLMIAGRDKA
ncbi:MAG: MraY family glycosyltransferase [Elusimicrobiota bacterium]